MPEGSKVIWDIELKNTNDAYFIINEQIVKQTTLEHIMKTDKETNKLFYCLYKQ